MRSRDFPPSRRRLTAAIGAALVGLPALVAAAPHPEGAQPHCVAPPFRADDPGHRRAAAAVPVGRGGGEPALAPVAPVGDIHLLVILAQFTDIPARIAPSRFQQHLFGSGTTLRDYYSTVSDGRLQVTGDIVGWVDLPGTQFSYSQGGGGIGTYPDNGQRMTEDAVTQAVLGGTNLSNYDSDGDGVVDALLVIHSGQGFEWAGESGNTPSPDPYAINSHKWVTVESDLGGGALVEDYFTCPELQIVSAADFPAWSDSIATIGVFCHEFGHVLGLPDYYDTGTGQSRLGVWDIMDFGTWNRDASVPVHSLYGALPAGFSAWSRMFLQWEMPMEITPPAGESTTQTVTLGSASVGAPALQVLSNPGGVDWTMSSAGSGEYFLAEVRTRTGYDKGLPSEGLLLYHVDEGQQSNRESEATYSGGGLLVLMPQDADIRLSTLSLQADPWPGGQETFDESSNPSSDLFSGAQSGVTIAGIGPISGTSVSALISVDNLAPTPRLPFSRPHPWRPAEGDVQIVLALDSPPGPSVVRIYDVTGRPVRTLDSPGEFLEVGRVARWDGTDDAGRRAPSGFYAFRAEGAASGIGKLFLLR